MRIGIAAAGAVGGYFGARLAAAGHDVVFFARGAHLAAMRERGLKIESPIGDVVVSPVQATDDARTVTPVDVVLFAVKLWDTECAGALARPIVRADTLVIALQNGVDSVERLTPVIGVPVVGGTAFISAVVKAPGVIRHVSTFARISCGWVGPHADGRLSAFVAAAKAAGVEISESHAMQRERWEKFVFLVALSGATCLTRMPIGAVLADSDGRAMVRALVAEVVAVGRASGVALPADCERDQLATLEALPAEMKASMLHDLEQRNRLELDWLSGHVVELGRKLAVPTPMNTAVYTALKLHRLGVH